MTSLSKEARELIDFDLKHIWHPAAQMKDYETFEPVPVVRGDGS